MGDDRPPPTPSAPLPPTPNPAGPAPPPVARPLLEGLEVWVRSLQRQIAEDVPRWKTSLEDEAKKKEEGGPAGLSLRCPALQASFSGGGQARGP